jgi:hypothetical protein
MRGLIAAALSVRVRARDPGPRRSALVQENAPPIPRTRQDSTGSNGASRLDGAPDFEDAPSVQTSGVSAARTCHT